MPVIAPRAAAGGAAAQPGPLAITNSAWRPAPRPGSMRLVRRLEFWPEYGKTGPLWEGRGQPVDLSTLGLSADLRERLARWNEVYSDDKLPVEGGGDAEWLAQGAGLLVELRTALGADVEVVTHEDWWGEPGLPFEQAPRCRSSALLPINEHLF